MSARLLSKEINQNTSKAVIGIFAPCDPRIDENSRDRCKNLVRNTAEQLSGAIKLPCGNVVEVVYSDILVDLEPQADMVAKQFLQAGVNILVCIPDTWSFPQLTTISLLSHFPKDIPINFTTGNSAARPGVVYTHATNGAIAQYGKLSHINIGAWPDKGQNPKMSTETLVALIDWCYAATTFQGLKGRRIVIFGHDSMGMETALPHVMETRNRFGIEITRLDMKLLSDMLQKQSYDKKEVEKLKNWLYSHGKERIELPTEKDEELLEKSLALYLIVRDIIKDLDAVGGGFMSQLEWGSDDRGIQLPVADIMESLFNSTFDHNGEKEVIPFATEADVQGLLTQLFMTWLSGGNPPLFMDFRKVYEKEDAAALAKDHGIKDLKNKKWIEKGFVDGVNSGSASFNWAASPGASEKEIMNKIQFPKAVDYFFYLGNSVHFKSPGEIKGVAARLSYSSLSGMFSMLWDEAETVELPAEVAQKVCDGANPTWPHTFVIPKYASMIEYKQYAPANHFHMTWDLKPARLQYWMDFVNVISLTPWAARPQFIEGKDRPLPLVYLLNGGEDLAKTKLAGK
ncbi:hypothetical protein [Zunongwangia sp. HRR-M8]|uniref:hypothetical protein n=1 Tax=Zunongwangia sp. HRR-M8 TaxID=3015170 RepID=UPI0022DD84F2|nr:hypothetical protein [Zunongwangia sp. HRR-M8]WBL23354.1 hypothetical protein PBT89_05215 [Zunongwangia sp. HRR-M8]